MKKWQLIVLPLLDLLIIGLTFLPLVEIEVLKVSAYRIPELATEYFSSNDPMRYFVFAIYLIPLISIWQFVDILTHHAWQLLSWIQLAVVLAFLAISLLHGYPFDIEPGIGIYLTLAVIVVKILIQFKGGSAIAK